jgi:hypothetical protein
MMSHLSLIIGLKIRPHPHVKIIQLRRSFFMTNWPWIEPSTSSYSQPNAAILPSWSGIPSAVETLCFPTHQFNHHSLPVLNLLFHSLYDGTELTGPFGTIIQAVFSAIMIIQPDKWLSSRHTSMIWSSFQRPHQKNKLNTSSVGQTPLGIKPNMSIWALVQLWSTSCNRRLT